jgi:TolB protein
MNSDGSGVTRLTTTAGFDGEPAWSPDGEWIAYQSEAGGVQGIYLMRADGSEPRLLIENAVSPAWRPAPRP